MNLQNSVLPVSVDRSIIESQYGYDIMLPFDSTLLYLQLKVTDKRGIYFHIPKRQIVAMRKNELSGLESFFVLPCYKRTDDLIKDFKTNSDIIIANTCFMNPLDSIFDLKPGKNSRSVNYTDVCPTCFRKCIPPFRKSMILEFLYISIEKSLHVEGKEKIIKFKANEELSFKKVFRDYNLETKDLLNKSHMFLFLDYRRLKSIFNNEKYNGA